MNCTELAPVPITAIARTVEGYVVVPRGGVEGGAGEAVATRDVGEARPVELADRADDRVHDDGVLGPVGGAGDQRPRAFGVVPRGGPHLGAEPDALLQPELARAGAEVVEEHVLGGEVQRPVVPLRERVAVVVVGVVDPAAGIPVLVPGATDVGVLLQHHEVDPRLGEPVRGEQAGHARADDRDAEIDIGRDVDLAPLGHAAIVTAERELLLEQGEVLLHAGAADHVLHDPQQIGAPRRRRGPAPAVAEADEGRRRDLAGGGELRRVQPTLGERHEGRVGAQVVPQQ